MGLAPQTRFGSYNVGEPLGAGGMGEVFLATDLALGRKVAIKALPDALASDPDRLARFEHEARTLAALNHPNIAHVYGLEQSGNVRAFVMELVEGLTLAERIAAGPLPADEALAIALQIAAALEAAHGQGIVHRDLKPANIKLKSDGTVKVLDFGIAKTLATARTVSGVPPPLATPAATETGIVLGTAAYMSPEQARGKAVDQRTDIWAFGCVLYELLTGRRAFDGEDVATTLARIVERDLEWSSLPESIAPAVRQTIALCLKKDVHKRLADIRDVRLALQGAFEPDALPLPHRPATRRWVWPVAAALAIGAAAVAVWSRPAAPEATAPALVTRFSIPVEGVQIYPRLSADGSTVGFVGGTPRRIQIRRLSELEVRPLPGTESSSGIPCFSPDGAWAAYSDNVGQLWKIPTSGQSPPTLVTRVDRGAGTGCDWADDGNIYFSIADGLARVSEVGGRAETISERSAGETSYNEPQLLPGGQQILLSVFEGATRYAVIVDLATRTKTKIIDGAVPTKFVPVAPGATAGHLVATTADGIVAAPFDLTRVAAVTPSSLPNGPPRAVAASAAVSPSGTLVHLDTLPETDNLLVWIGRDGVEAALPEPSQAYGIGSLSPDGRFAATTISARSNADIWLYDTEENRQTRLTFGAFNIPGPFTADGARLFFASSPTTQISTREIRVMPTDGSGPPLTLGSFESVNSTGGPTSVSFDGATLLGTRYVSFTNGDVWMLHLDDAAASQEPQPLLATGFNERHAVFSPDSRWRATALGSCCNSALQPRARGSR